MIPATLAHAPRRTEVFEFIKAEVRDGHPVPSPQAIADPREPGDPLNDPDKLDDCAIPGVKDQWVAVATAMLAEARAAARTVETPLIAAQPKPELAPMRCWIAVIKHPTLENDVLYRLEYDAAPRRYGSTHGKATLIERVELPPEVERTLIAAAKWWNARRSTPVEPVKEIAP